MAKGFGKDDKGVIVYESRSQALSGLSGNAGILVGTKLATSEDFKMLRNETTAMLTGLTVGQGGGLLFGIADGDLTLVEIEEALDRNGPLTRVDSDGMNVANRAVFITGVYEPRSLDEDEGLFRDKITDALILSSKLRWRFHKTASWNYFVYNAGTTITTGASVKIHSKSWGLWLDA